MTPFTIEVGADRYEKLKTSAVRRYAKLDWPSAAMFVLGVGIFASVLGVSTGSSAGLIIAFVAVGSALFRVSYMTMINREIFTPTRRPEGTRALMQFQYGPDAVVIVRDDYTRERRWAEFDQGKWSDTGLLLRSRENKTVFFTPLAHEHSTEREDLEAALFDSGVNVR